jgi:hypothetical protein
MLQTPSDDKSGVYNVQGPGNFQFSGTRPEHLGASEYTLATLICDATGSVREFVAMLKTMMKMIIDSCQKHPRAENLLVRALSFNTDVYEIHGFKPLSEINLSDYDNIDPTGMTALYDAAYDGIGATVDYAKILVEQDFDVNGAVYLITDGSDNQSRLDPADIKKKVDDALKAEDIESIITILVGVKDPNEPDAAWAQHVSEKLKKFMDEGGLSQYIEAGDATPETLAKLANFVSESISSQSQALGTGAPSQTLQF